MPSRSFLPTLGRVRRGLLVLALSLQAGAALAQAWPSKTIRIVVPWPPGGPTDTAARIIGQKMGEQLKQPVIVENRAGASGTIAAAAVAKSPADGYTLMMLATPTLLAPHLYKQPGYDPLRDFAPVGTAYDLPIVVVVNPKLLPEVKDLQQLIGTAQAQDGKLNYTSSGKGSFGHLTMESLKTLGKFDMQHVPTGAARRPSPTCWAARCRSCMPTWSPRCRTSSRASCAPSRSARRSACRSPPTSRPSPSRASPVSSRLVGRPAGARRHAEGRRRAPERQAQAGAGRPHRAGQAAGSRHLRGLPGPRTDGARMSRDYEKWGKVIKEKNIEID